MISTQVKDLQSQLISEFANAPGMFRELSRMESMLAETYRNRIQYELLQNSDDAKANKIEVRLSQSHFTWKNNGRPLSIADIESLSRSASSEKTRGESIGYRGIGFKSLAAIAQLIEIRSPGVSFSYSRDEAAALLENAGFGSEASQLPLIRIPTKISSLNDQVTVDFNIHAPEESIGEIDPLALLFLRNVTSVITDKNGEISRMDVEKTGDSLTIVKDDERLDFFILKGEVASIAVPLNSRALGSTGRLGKLACFLPLDDGIGIPLVVSGDLMTDPARKHAILEDSSTRRVINDAAQIIADHLADPVSPVFNDLWTLFLEAGDLRFHSFDPESTAASMFITSLSGLIRKRDLSFGYSSSVLNDADRNILFPAGAPIGLYRSEYQEAAKSLKSLWGLQTVDLVSKLTEEELDLSESLLSSVSLKIVEQVKVLSRIPNLVERKVLDKAGMVVQPSITPVIQQPLVPKLKASNDPSSPKTTPIQLAEVIDRWRVAELAVLEWLNLHGWQLQDVSKQNMGYDLTGSDSNGRPVNIEIKKVDSLSSSFSMTNNEMALMQSSTTNFLLGLIVGAGKTSRLKLIDPMQENVPRERVCRRWDWEFSNWSDYGTWI